MRTFKVYLSGKEVGIYHWYGKITPEEVKENLIKEDGYSPNIEVEEEIEYDY